MTSRARGEGLLRKLIDASDARFRPGQWEAIAAVVERSERLLVVQATGWGKSMVYFLATRLLRDLGRGPTLLISPLLSLMRNQLGAARRLGLRAETVNTENRKQWGGVRDRLARGQIDVLLISPERLANSDFRERYLLPVAGKVGLFVVDEAHCISDWGHDFRPDYRRILGILKVLPRSVPVLATTATANERVVRDVQEQFGDLKVVRGPLVRSSLRLQNLEIHGRPRRLAWLADTLPRLEGTGIIYVLTRRDAEQVARYLRQETRLHVDYYHASVAAEKKKALESSLMDNRLKAVVATTALSMGFDKPDLGFVVHFQRPGSVVHYYQQVGRAGRALPDAFGIMLYGPEDDQIHDYFIRSAFPSTADIHEVLGALDDADNGLNKYQICSQINLPLRRIEKVLHQLSVESPAPVVRRGDFWHATAVPFTHDQVRVHAITQTRRRELDRMDEYSRHQGCLMEFLTRELDDPEAKPCGRCASCRGAPYFPSGFRRALQVQARRHVEQQQHMIKPRTQWPKGAFPNYGWEGTVRDADPFMVGRALCQYGEGRLGELVRRGKYEEGRFGPELVEAAVELVSQRWRPRPEPEWVTCVPSSSAPDLVPRFAEALADALGLDFVPVFRREISNKPQKSMQNYWHQAHNLDGVFAVRPNMVSYEPVLLVDDMVDSRWTFMVTAALLQQAGCRAVYPLALATSWQGGGDL